jgi:hypothetical protein
MVQRIDDNIGHVQDNVEGEIIELMDRRAWTVVEILPRGIFK